jgi:hypothetical protein
MLMEHTILQERAGRVIMMGPVEMDNEMGLSVGVFENKIIMGGAWSSS